MNAINFKDIAIKCGLCKKEHEGPSGLAYIKIGSSIKLITCVCPECEKKLTDGINDLIGSLGKEEKYAASNHCS